MKLQLLEIKESINLYFECTSKDISFQIVSSNNKVGNKIN